MRNVAHITTRVSKSTLTIGVVSVHGYTVHSVNHVTTKGKEVDHNLWLWEPRYYEYSSFYKPTMQKKLPFTPRKSELLFLGTSLVL